MYFQIIPEFYFFFLFIADELSLEADSKRRNICRYCQKIFPAPSLLQRHERTHTGEKPYHCQVCGRGFALKGGLKSHQVIHISKEKLL